VIPSSIQLPNHEFAFQDKQASAYMKELIIRLEEMYGSIAGNLNGSFRNDQDSYQPFIPAVRTSNNDEGTVTYDHQTGWVWRSGIMTDVWFDVEWTAASGTPTGNLILDLPYLVANSANKPFVGTAQVDNLTYTNSYVTCNATPDTRELTFWGCGSAAAETQVAFDSVAQVIGHVRYIGQSEENENL